MEPFTARLNKNGLIKSEARGIPDLFLVEVPFLNLRPSLSGNFKSYFFSV